MVLLLYRGTLCRFERGEELLRETEELLAKRQQLPEHPLSLEDVYLFHAQEQLTES